jgi:ferric-dicitrate binding protein FerR (iron transport regulator)
MGQEDKKMTWNLIAKKLMGEAAPEELHELERLLKDNPELHYPMQTIIDLWKSSADLNKDEAEKAFSRHLDRIKDLSIDFPLVDVVAAEYPQGYPDPVDGPLPGKRLSGRHTLLLTGLFATLFLAAAWFYNRAPESLPAPVAHLPVPAANDIYTANGSRTHLTLPDGTLVWLNAGSRLSYGKNYNGTAREVSLTGEAFFDVARNSQKPFLIHTARIDIQVLGTSFNVKSYPTDRTTEATLIRGSIEVSIKDRPSEKIILKPNEKLVVANDDSTLLRSSPGRYPASVRDESLVSIRKPTYEQSTGAIIETSWVDNKLSFKGETFGELALQMERWYGVTIRFSDPALEQLQFTGSFKEETIQQALEALKLTAMFTYTIEGSQIDVNK